MENSKKKILIVDDSELNRALLADMLEDRFDIFEAGNGMEALAILHEHDYEIALMLLDIVMPVMDGFEVLAAMNGNGLIKTMPVIMISAENSGTYIDRAYDLGAIDYISRPFDERTVKHRVISNYMLALKQKEMQELLSAQIYEKEKDNGLLIEILSHIVEFRNGESGLHVLHVHTITERLLNCLVKKTDKYKLSPRDIRIISTASALHDIGKISIPSKILNKPGRFTSEEYEIMKEHSVRGAKMLESIPFRNEEALIKISYEICRWHHERYDGSGYPDGLVGDATPISAQVVAIADVYDALISKRVYKDSMPSEKAVDMIVRGECGAFNPILVECLKEEADALKNELEVISYGARTDLDIKTAVEQILKYDGTDVSRRIIKHYEHERMKYRYLADISHEITFEYVPSPEMVKLSDWSADSMSLPVDILNPTENEAWTGIFRREAFIKFLDKLRATDPNNSVVDEKYVLDMGDGEKWYRVVAKAMWTDDEKPEFEGAVCKVVDINESERAVHNLEHAVRRDSMTGLYNRKAAMDHVQKLLDARSGKHYALVFFDLDNFKSANDKYGHNFGDSVIEALAQRIKNNVRSSDIAARVGGDEFIIFMEYKDNVEPQVKRIFGELCGEYNGYDIKISMGVATTEDNGISFDTLVSMADVAMYSVKNDGKSTYGFYDDSMEPLLKAGVKHNKRAPKEEK